jgi:hypothetical protein
MIFPANRCDRSALVLICASRTSSASPLPAAKDAFDILLLP